MNSSEQQINDPLQPGLLKTDVGCSLSSPDITMYVWDKKTGNRMEVPLNAAFSHLSIGFQQGEKAIEVPVVPLHLYQFYVGEFSPFS